MTTDAAGASPVERRVRPLRWQCQSCDWTGDDAELLRAPNPFNPADTICGCPKCRAADDFVNTCDEPGCDKEAQCGFPSPQGYRRTCSRHAYADPVRPNAQAERETP